MGTRAGAVHHHSTRHQGALFLGVLGWVAVADAGFVAWLLARYVALATVSLRVLLVFVGAEGIIAAGLVVAAMIAAVRERGLRHWLRHHHARDRTVDVQAIVRPPVAR